MREKAVFNWSGGKDSMLALHKVLEENRFEIVALLTTLNEKYNRISMHGVRAELLEQQAERLGFPLKKIMLPERADMETYSRIMGEETAYWKAQGVTVFLFGDLFLEDIRAYREKQLAGSGIRPEFPIWQYGTQKAASDFIDLGYKAVLTSVDASKLNETFAGRYFDEKLLADLPEAVDPCGENGEFHSFVFDGPLFSQPVNFQKGETVRKTYQLQDKSVSAGFYFTDLEPVEQPNQ
jgi:uncharacterized protein (TIGR00290 family)